MSTTLVQEFHRKSAAIGASDAYTSSWSARMNARLDEATAETHEAWRVSAHAMLHNPLLTPHAPLQLQITEAGPDVPLFVRVPPLYGLRDPAGAGAYAIDTDTTDSSSSSSSSSYSSDATRTVRAGSVGYSISARPLYHTHALDLAVHPVHVVNINAERTMPRVVLKDGSLPMRVGAPVVLPSILAVIAAAEVEVEAGVEMVVVVAVEVAAFQIPE